MKTRVSLSLTQGLVLAVTLIWLLSNQSTGASTGPATRYVAPGGNCSDMTPCYATVQAAVDAANPLDTIKVAQGVYTNVTTREGVTQAAYISKTVVLRGGYTTTDWAAPNPESHPTTLDAEGKGRVLYITGNISPTIEGFNIAEGSAAGQGGFWGYDAGSGMFIISAKAVISGNTIYNSSGAYVGAGLFLQYSDSSISNNNIHHNVTASGGEGGGIYLNESAATVEGNRITNNDTTSGKGGGIHLSYDRSNVVNNRISANLGSMGGGIFMNESVSTLKRNVIDNNSATWAGGGIHIEGANPTLENNAVLRNEATVKGSGIHLAGTLANLLHTTIADNSGGDGSGVWVGNDILVPGNVILRNTILSGHNVGISVSEQNTATLTSTLWHDNIQDRGGAGVINHTSDKSGNPKYTFDGYHLSPGSAAIDLGVDAGVLVDIDGKARPWGDGYDLGADEFDGAVMDPRLLFLPLSMNQY